MIKYATQWVVTPESLEQKTAEMINSVIYYTAAAQRPPKQVKFDFYYMHCTNCSIFFPTFNNQSWLSTANKVRLLQWKGYLDLAMYASRRSPPLLLEEVSMYVPAKMEKGEGEWPGIFERLWEFKDDGHAIKLGRAVRNGELTSGKYGDVEWERIKGFMWEKIGNMVIDSVEDDGVNCKLFFPISIKSEDQSSGFGDKLLFSRSNSNWPCEDTSKCSLWISPAPSNSQASPLGHT